MKKSVILSIVNELEQSAQLVKQEDIDKLVNLIGNSNRVFVAGAGLSLIHI